MFLPWFPRAIKGIHEPFKRGFSVFCSCMVVLEVSPIGFQSLPFRELISLRQDLRVGVPDVEYRPLTTQGKVSYF